MKVVKPHYVIVTGPRGIGTRSYYTKTIGEEVSECLQNGYIPVGGPTISKEGDMWIYHQAMVKYGQGEEK